MNIEHSDYKNLQFYNTDEVAEENEYEMDFDDGEARHLSDYHHDEHDNSDEHKPIEDNIRVISGKPPKGPENQLLSTMQNYRNRSLDRKQSAFNSN